MTSINPLPRQLYRYLSNLTQKVFTEPELHRSITDFAQAVNHPFSVVPEEYVDYLVEKEWLRRIHLLKGDGGSIERYTCGSPSPYEIAVSLKGGAFVSHLSAAALHGLVDTDNELLYVTAEAAQRPKEAFTITQAAIDTAFGKEQRRSKALYEWEGGKALLVSSMYTGRAGVVKGRSFSVASPERTLLDMVVRPAYGGGATAIMEAFRKARGIISVAAMVTLLDTIPFIYPYHQALGFYLTLAGYKKEDLKELKNRPMPYRFYLDYALEAPIYSSIWKIYYPADLDLQKKEQPTS